MKDKQYQKIKEHVPAIVNFETEVKLIEDYFAKKKLNLESMSVIFWNHIITLFQRIDANEQNDMALDSVESMTERAQNLTKGFVEFINKHRAFDVTDFERYLLSIYFEQTTEEKGE